MPLDPQSQQKESEKPPRGLVYGPEVLVLGVPIAWPLPIGGTAGGAGAVSILVNGTGITMSLAILTVLTTNEANPNSSDEKEFIKEQEAGRAKEATRQKARSKANRKYSKHAKDRMKEQNISEDRVEEGIEKGKTEPGNDPGTTEHWLPGAQSISVRGIRVVTDVVGDVITVSDKGTTWKGGRLWK